MSTMNLTLLTDFYELTMMQGISNPRTMKGVVFDAFYRKTPVTAVMPSRQASIRSSITSKISVFQGGCGISPRS